MARLDDLDIKTELGHIYITTDNKKFFNEEKAIKHQIKIHNKFNRFEL